MTREESLKFDRMLEIAEALETSPSRKSDPDNGSSDEIYEVDERVLLEAVELLCWAADEADRAQVDRWHEEVA